MKNYEKYLIICFLVITGFIILSGGIVSANTFGHSSPCSNTDESPGAGQSGYTKFTLSESGTLLSIHKIATQSEKKYAKKLKVNWKKYGQRINTLYSRRKR